MPYLRHRSFVLAPASPSFNTPIICSSVNRFDFMVRSHVGGLYSWAVLFAGITSLSGSRPLLHQLQEEFCLQHFAAFVHLDSVYTQILAECTGAQRTCEARTSARGRGRRRNCRRPDRDPLRPVGGLEKDTGLTRQGQDLTFKPQELYTMPRTRALVPDGNTNSLQRQSLVVDKPTGARNPAQEGALLRCRPDFEPIAPVLLHGRNLGARL